MSRSQRRFGSKSYARENRHHRRPRSRGGRTTPDNISFVPVVKHMLWHEMWGNMLPDEICARINEVWLDPAYKFVCVKR
jgi:hypothetical protein